MRENARYEGSPSHKRAPGDFGLTPPAHPRPDKSLCDEAGVFTKERAEHIFARAIQGGLVSEQTKAGGFPSQLWAVDGDRVFEAIYGGSRTGSYHGYPIRKSDPFFAEIISRWTLP